MLAFDHLVVGADTLEQGARWCAETLGVEPAGGGKHPLMGTHNRLLAIGSPAFPKAYLEIIAIDPEAAPPGRPRWFGLDDPALRDALREQPRLLHWVARCADLDATCGAMRTLGLEPGVPTEATRGSLAWRIAIRADGRPECGGASPTPIEWQAVHPSDSMPACGVALASLSLRGVPAGLAALLPAGVACTGRSGAALEACLETPRGAVRLVSRQP